MADFTPRLPDTAVSVDEEIATADVTHRLTDRAVSTKEGESSCDVEFAVVNGGQQQIAVIGHDRKLGVHVKLEQPQKRAQSLERCPLIRLFGLTKIRVQASSYSTFCLPTKPNRASSCGTYRSPTKHNRTSSCGTFRSPTKANQTCGYLPRQTAPPRMSFSYPD